MIAGNNVFIINVNLLFVHLFFLCIEAKWLCKRYLTDHLIAFIHIFMIVWLHFFTVFVIISYHFIIDLYFWLNDYINK